MKFLWTNFRSLLQKFRAASLLNIAGLAVALAVAIVVAIQVRWDFTYDRGYANAEKIFTIRRYMHADGVLLRASTWQWPIEIKAAIPEVEGYTLFNRMGEMTMDRPTSGDNREQHTVTHYSVRGDFLRMFSPEIVAGDTTGLFRDPGLALISRRNAERIFGRADAVGEVLYRHGDDTPLVIAAVYEDFPENRTVENGLYSYIEDNWAGGSFSYEVYYMIDPALAPAVVEKLNDPAFKTGPLNYDEREAALLEIRLPALADMHLYQERAGGARQINTTLSLLAIGTLVLVIAWINFFNLAMAMAPSRVRSINIHRILGIGKGNLRMAMAFEGVGLTLIALVVALAAVHGFSGTPMAGLFDSPLALAANVPVIAGVAGVALAAAFIVGIYAARYSTSFDVAIALKSSFVLSKSSAALRSTLIVVQFAVAMIFMVVAGTVKIQHDYMVNRSWGFDSENVIYVEGANLGRENWESFGEELKKNPAVADWTVTVSLPGQGMWSWNSREFEGKTINVTQQWVVWPNFLRFFDVGLVAGNDFAEDYDGEPHIIFNEEFARTYDFRPDEIVGKNFWGDEGEIVGVSENVHFETMHEPLKPLAFVTLTGDVNFGYYMIKIAGGDIPASLAHIERTWKKFTDVEFSYKFLDDEMNNLYRRESNMARLIGLFGLVTVIIAMMGVYGLIFFNSRYRTREIAIRKVNGAEVGEVVRMLNRAMFIQLGVAFVVATPVAWFVVRRWLEGFAYRADVPWWLFAVSGVAVAAVSLATVSSRSYKAATANPVESLKSE